MGKIGTYSILATSTSAALTDFAFSSLPSDINGKLLRYWIEVPAVSAATCSASILQHDVDNNEIWRSDGAKDHSTFGEATSGAATMSEMPIVGGDHFHLEWSAAPSGALAGPPGANCNTTLKLYIEESKR